MAHETENTGESPTERKYLPVKVDFKNSFYDEDIDTLYLIFTPGVGAVPDQAEDSSDQKADISLLINMGDTQEVVGLMIEDFKSRFLHPRRR